MGAPLALGVRSVRAATVRTFAPPYSQPFEVLNHGPDKLLARALGIKIFIAEHQRPTLLRSALRRSAEGPGVSYVQQTSGRRRQPAAIAVLTGIGGHSRILTAG